MSTISSTTSIKGSVGFEKPVDGFERFLDKCFSERDLKVLFPAPSRMMVELFLPDPESTETVYHYCVLGTFMKIVESERLWLTPMSKMNDTSEGLWVHEKLPCLIKLERERLKNRLRKSMAFLSCLSSDGDVLSQWRAYGMDGAGVAIGFSKKAR